MKTEDGGACLHCEQNGTLFRDVPRAAGAVDCESGVAALTDLPRHLDESAKTAAGTGTAGGAESESLDALSDRFAVLVQAGHDDDSTVAPIVSRWKNAAVPEGEDCASSGFINVVEMGIAFGFPPDGPADDGDGDRA